MVDFKDVADKDFTAHGSLSDQILQRVQGRFSLGGLSTLIFKFVFVLVLPFILFSYEKFNKNRLMQLQVKAKAQLDIRKKELDKEKKKLAKYNKNHLKEKEFNNKMDILKSLAEERLVAIKVLDTMQNATLNFSGEEREFLFFNSITINGDRISIDGSASSENTINQFVERLQQEPVYKVIQWEDVKSDQKSKIKKFKVSGQISSKG